LKRGGFHLGFLALGVVAGVLTFAAGALAERYGEIEVTAQASAGGATTHGYAAYTFNITNDSKTDEHVVTLRMPGDNTYGSNYIYSIWRSVRVGPEQTAKITLYQPPLPMDGRGVAVAIDGRQQQRLVSVGGFDHMEQFRWGSHYGSSTDAFKIMISRSINRSNLEASFQKVQPGVTSRALAMHREREFIQNELPVEAWSSRWLGYSRFDAVVLTADEMDTLPQPVRGALDGYVEAGGSLVIVGEYEPAPTWRKDEDQRYGVYYHGFGRVLIVDKPVGEWEHLEVSFVASMAQDAVKPFSNVRNVQQANKAFAIVENLGVPVRGLFALMLVFAVLIGPVNLVVLSKKKRRIWLLWTVPLLSLVACGAVFAYNMLAEGWTSHSRIATFTVLDQNTRRAATIGWCAFYAPLTPGDGLHFTYEDELTPQVLDRGFGRADRPRSIDWTSDQHLVSGWVTSRVPAHFMLRRAHTERQRIDLTRGDDGTITATNGLGVDIVALHYADGEGRMHTVENLPAGQKASLVAGDIDQHVVSRGADHLSEVYTTDWIRAFDAEQATTHLRPGDYVAVLSQSPFVEQPLEGAVPRAATSVIYGITEAAQR